MFIIRKLIPITTGLNFGDMDDADKICHKNKVNGADESSMMLRDLDGSLTGTPGQSVTADVPYYHDGIECKTKSEWNMTICQGYFARVKLRAARNIFSHI